jgi:malonyl-CoA O-methyltransferase
MQKPNPKSNFVFYRLSQFACNGLMFQETIQKNFSRNAHTYDTSATIQRQCAEHLVQYLQIKHPNLAPQSILDVGAGTGYLTHILSQCFSHSTYHLNDISPEMLKISQKRLHHLHTTWHVGDAQKLQFPFVDLIVSNLTLQWFDALEAGIQHLSSFTPCLALSFLLDGTFDDWYQKLYHLSN